MRDLRHRLTVAQWAAWIDGHRRLMLLAPILVMLLCTPLAIRVTDDLTIGGWLPPEAETVAVDDLLMQEFGHQTTNHYLLFTDPTGQLKASDPQFRREVERIVAPLRSDPMVEAVYTWGTTTNRTMNQILISDDGAQSLAIVALNTDVEGAVADFDRFTGMLTSDVLDIRIGGWTASTVDLQAITTRDLTRAELISLPITLVLLVLMYGGVVAMVLPLGLAIGAIGVAFAALAILATQMEASIFAINAITMLGLAVGIDYALMMVSRFREELGNGLPPDRALAQTLATAGRAVLVSGIAVAIGLTGLVAIGLPAAVSTGLTGAVVVIASVVLVWTSLPAAMLLLGPRLAMSRREPGLVARIGAPLGTILGRIRASGRARSWVSVIGGLALLVVLTLPVFQMRAGAVSMTLLPESASSRQFVDTVEADFTGVTLSPITVVVQPRSGRLTSSTNLEDLQRLTTELAALPGVASVDSLWSFVPEGTSALLLSTSLTLDQSLQEATAPYVTSRAALIQLSPDDALSREEREALVETIRTRARALSHGNFTLLVGGESATNLDLVDAVAARVPLAIGIMLLATWVVLFLQFRSVLLPIKAIALNLLSIGASFGAVVWVFQEGHLAGMFGVEPLGYTVILVPMLMICFMFGLSMDYEVIMLARIREAWLRTGDNDLAVTEGLRKSAGIVTNAALVMFVVFAAFSTSELQLIRALGMGLALAVLLDATLIRLVLLPALMRLMGRWNWWSPRIGRSSARMMEREELV